MNESDKKRLTEFLKLEWKTVDNSWGDDYPCSNRSFTTPQDMMDLKDMIDKKRLWKRFFSFACNASDMPVKLHSFEDFVNWLLNAPRFCQLTANFLKEKHHD